MLRLTPVVRNLIMINTIVYLLQMIMSDLHVTEYLSLWNIRSENFRPYQLFTYMFVHSPSSFTHIFFNMLTLVFVGPILENYWGPKRFLLFYVVCGIGAGVFNVIVDLFFGVGTFGIMLGASGAIYGVLMGFGMMFPNMEIMLLIPPIPIKAKYLVFVLGGMTFLLDRSGNVAHFTHLGGIIFAFIMIRIWRTQGGNY
ncbi:MAG TPA: rhomboid family intramembrane serine protease [Chryseosolibacter sp.]